MYYVIKILLPILKNTPGINTFALLFLSCVISNMLIHLTSFSASLWLDT